MFFCFVFVVKGFPLFSCFLTLVIIVTLLFCISYFPTSSLRIFPFLLWIFTFSCSNLPQSCSPSRYQRASFFISLSLSNSNGCFVVNMLPFLRFQRTFQGPLAHFVEQSPSFVLTADRHDAHVGLHVFGQRYDDNVGPNHSCGPSNVSSFLSLWQWIQGWPFVVNARTLGNRVGDATPTMSLKDVVPPNVCGMFKFST